MSSKNSPQTNSTKEPAQWYVYILLCTDGSLYTGVTTNIERRFREHQTGRSGAKYTKARKPVRVVHKETCASRSEAQVREAAIKKLTRMQKEILIQK